MIELILQRIFGKFSRQSCRFSHEALKTRLAALPKDTSAIAKLETAIETHLVLLLAQEDIASATIKLIWQVPQPLRDRVLSGQRTYGALWKSLLSAARKSGAIRQDLDLSVVRMSILGALNWAADWYKPGRMTPEEIARDTAEKLRLRLNGNEQKQLTKNYATNSEAYRLYLQGRYYWNQRTAEGLQQGSEYFNQVISKDPNYAPAYTGLADCYALLNVYNVVPATEVYQKAQVAAARALELDESLAEAHTSLAFVRYRYYWDWEQAEQHFKRAIELKSD